MSLYCSILAVTEVPSSVSKINDLITPPAQKLYYTVVINGYISRFCITHRFSFPQIQQFCLLTNLLKWKWVWSLKMICFAKLLSTASPARTQLSKLPLPPIISWLKILCKLNFVCTHGDLYAKFNSVKWLGYPTGANVSKMIFREIFSDTVLHNNKLFLSSMSTFLLRRFYL